MRAFVVILTAVAAAWSLGPLAASAAPVRGEAPATAPSLTAPSLDGGALAAANQTFARIVMADNFDGDVLAGASAAPYSAGLSNFPGLFTDRYRFSTSPANSAYLGLAQGGQFVGTTLKFGSSLRFHIANSTLEPFRNQAGFSASSPVAKLQGNQPALDVRQAETTEAGVTLNLTPWAGIDLTASQSTERDGVLSGVDTGANALTRSGKTDAVGLSARLGFGDGWVTTFSYGEGVTQLDLRPTPVIAGTDTLHSRAYGLAVAKHGLFSQSDSLGFAFTRPVESFDSIAALSEVAASSAARQGPLDQLSLAGASPETDVELGYITTFFDGALALKANAGYQMNLAGQKGLNSVTVLTRAKINF